MKKIVKLLAILIFTSCITTRQYVSQVIKTESIINPETKNILVYGTDNVRVNSFNKTYQKNYKTDKDFRLSFIKEFELEVKKAKLFSNVSSDEINKSDENIEQILLETKENYIISFTNFEITNRIETSFSAPMGPNGFGGAGHHTSVEYCIVNAEVVVYDTKSKKKILEFVTIGESSVFLFDFTKTLKKAKNRAIMHAINYLKSGKMVYKVS